MLLHVSVGIVLQHSCSDMECKTYILNDLQRKEQLIHASKMRGFLYLLLPCYYTEAESWWG